MPGRGLGFDLFKRSLTVMNYLSDLWKFLRVRKKYWMIPLLVFLLTFGALVVLTGGSAVAPFIYAIF
jgi:hypothetical protein